MKIIMNSAKLIQKHMNGNSEKFISMNFLKWLLIKMSALRFHTLCYKIKVWGM